MVRHYPFEHYFLARLGSGQQTIGGPRGVAHQPVAIGQFHPRQPLGERLDNPTAYADWLGPGHVKISGSPSVTAMVCSQCAEGCPSRVTTVHPSGRNFTLATPAFTIGSMASVMPGRSSGVLPPLTKLGTCGSS